MAGRKLHPSILREYDIRGVVGQTLFAEDFEAVGRCFASIARERAGRAPTVAVGYDGRLHSPELEAALVKGLTGTGAEVVRIGLGPTPMLYYATHELNADGGIMVTGSHNPPDQNGMKMVLRGESFYGADIQALGQRIERGEFHTGSGLVRDEEIKQRYVDRLARDFREGNDMTVVWDAGNGATGEVLAMLVKKLPGRHIVLFGDIDGRFPNHHPDPTEEKNLVDLKKAVKAEGADIGIAFDGDGDRIGVVDSQARVLWGDQILVILAREILTRRPGQPIVGDVKASRVLFDEVARAGGKPVVWKTGHSLIKTRMKEIGAPIAGEMSGHIFFADGYYGYDDALYAGVRLLSILTTAKESLAQMRDQLPQMYNTPEIRFECPEDRKFKVVDEVKARLAAQSGITVHDIDGVRVENADGWWLLRASNTQAVLVGRAESTTADGLKRLTSILGKELRASGIEPPADLA